MDTHDSSDTYVCPHVHVTTITCIYIYYVTVEVKTSLVHTPNLEVHNFPYERHTELKFTGLVEPTSFYRCWNFHPYVTLL